MKRWRALPLNRETRHAGAKLVIKEGRLPIRLVMARISVELLTFGGAKIRGPIACITKHRH